MRIPKTVVRMLSLLLTLCMVVTLLPGSVLTTSAEASSTTTLYLKPNANWQESNARFAVYYWNGSANNWTSMTDSDGDGLYEAQIPSGYSNVIFCRMNPGTTANNWTNKWNQTADLTVPNDGGNCYTVAEGAWDKGSGEWSTYVPDHYLYLKPNANWLKDGARFAIYYWNDDGSAWTSMADSDNDGYYEGVVPSEYSNVIFCRMNGSAADNNWSSKWNQSADLTIPTDGSNCYTVAEGAWDNGSGEWSVYPPEEPEIPADYYLAGYWGNADHADQSYKFVDGTLSMTFETDSYVYIMDNNGSSYKTATYCTATTGTFLPSGGETMLVPAGKVTFTLVENENGTLTLSYTVQTAPAADYYLEGYLNGADYTGQNYKFEAGQLTMTFTQSSYVYIVDNNGAKYKTASYCTDTTGTFLVGGGEKMLVPAGEVTFTLVENANGTLTLSYQQAISQPAIPDGYNTVALHFAKPAGWGSTINAYLWNTSGALPGYGDYNTWPGSAIGDNDSDGWYDITVGTETPQAFNFIFNDGSNQTADLTTGTVTGPTELWIVGNDVYTEKPKNLVVIHFQAPADWGTAISAYAWDGSDLLCGSWPGKAAPENPGNDGWYDLNLQTDLSAFNFIFNNNGNGKQTADLTTGPLTLETELWVTADGTVSSTAPDGWFDTDRTVHLPGTIGSNNWNAAGNQMEYDAATGLYTITFDDVTPGTYEYKIAINGSWGENYGANGEANGSNMSVSVPSKQDVTFWYSDNSHRVVCSISYDINAVITLSGTGIPAGTKLTDPDLTGLYSVKVSLPAGTYSDLKVTAGTTDIPFNTFALSSGKDVTFYYDPSTGLAYHDGADQKVDGSKIFYDSRDQDYKAPFGAVEAGETVTFAIETGTDATAVSLVVKGYPAVKLAKDGAAKDGVQKWTGETAFNSLGEYQYYFAISNGSDMVFYTDDNYNNYYKKGDYGTGTVRDINNLFPYDLVVYEAGYETPDWMKNAVIYQIFPDRFFNGDTANDQAQTWARGTVDYEYVTDWYLLPENPEMADDPNYPTYALKGDGEWSNEIYGGDLKGIVEQIDYLKALGVNVIYLNPVFWSISNHRYDAVDYSQIDPILGTLGDFEALVAVAEANDMHIILDGVFNHVSDDSIYFDRYYKFLPDAAEKYDGKIGAYPYWAYVYDLMNEEQVSQANAEAAAKAYFTEEYGITDYSYTEWFQVQNVQTANSDTIGLRAGKAVYSYEGWWGYDSMPVIYSTNGSEYQTGNWAEEIISGQNSINAYWIGKGMDGWRLDVANEVSDETWQNFRDSVKALDSDAVIIGEIWADSTHYLMGDMYDSVMNYVFRDAVAGFARGYLINRDNKAEMWDSDFTADDAITVLEILRERYPEEAFYAMMNLVASHDTSRILSYLDDVEDDRYQKDIEHAFPMYETTSDRAKQLQYVVSFLQFTYAGAPTIYYGDEIGMTGGDDPDDRRAFTWGKGNQDIVEWYAQMAAIRAAYPALRTGSVEAFSTGNDDLMGFVRADSTNTLTVLANRAAAEITYALEGTYVDLVTGETFTDTIAIPAYRGVILVAEDEVKAITVDTEALAPAYDPDFIYDPDKVEEDNKEEDNNKPTRPSKPADKEEPVQKFPFTDVSKNHWARNEITWVWQNSLMNGVSASAFAPEATLTRGMVVTILHRMEGTPDTKTDADFSDVKDSQWYTDAISWASEEEIVKGYDNGKFGPNDAITREQLATILFRYAKYKGMDVSVGEDTNILSYDDALTVSEYAIPAMQWACGAGLIKGADGKLMPAANATRAQFAAILYRFLNN